MAKMNGLSGLANLGNTCYLNSFLQCLSHTYEFNDYLDNSYSKSDKNILLNEWNNLRKLLWHKNCSIAPKRFVSYLHKVGKTNNTIFTDFSQNDVSELMYFIFDIFHKYLNDGISYIPKNNNKIELFKKKMYKKDYSIITKLFQGIQVSSISDMKDNVLNETPEQFMILPISIPNNINSSIDECIDNYCSVEILNNENKYALSEDSKKKIDAKKQIYFYELPQILIISLKRFRNNIRKNKDVVILNEELNLDKYCKNGDNSYELYGVNLHTGNINSGHYMAAIKNDNWYLFNDLSVSKINFNDLKTNYQAYCLFYRKKNSSI